MPKYIKAPKVTKYVRNIILTVVFDFSNEIFQTTHLEGQKWLHIFRMRFLFLVHCDVYILYTIYYVIIQVSKYLPTIKLELSRFLSINAIILKPIITTAKIAAPKDIANFGFCLIEILIEERCSMFEFCSLVFCDIFKICNMKEVWVIKRRTGIHSEKLDCYQTS